LAHTIVTGWEIIPPSGDGVTTIVALAVLEHPFAPVPVTVYVVVVVGLAVTVDPVPEDKPVEGLQI
jgi:hypothetical protein